MHHHTRQRTAFPALAVGPAFGRLRHQLRLLQPVFNPGVTAPAAIAFIPGIKMFDVPAFMPGPVTIFQAHDFIYRRPPVRNLIQPFVDQSVQAFVFVPVNIAPERPFADAQQPRCFFLRQTPALPTSICFFESHFPSLL